MAPVCNQPTYHATSADCLVPNVAQRAFVGFGDYLHIQDARTVLEEDNVRLRVIGNDGRRAVRLRQKVLQFSEHNECYSHNTGVPPVITAQRSSATAQ